MEECLWAYLVCLADWKQSGGCRAKQLGYCKSEICKTELENIPYYQCLNAVYFLCMSFFPPGFVSGTTLLTLSQWLQQGRRSRVGVILNTSMPWAWTKTMHPSISLSFPLNHKNVISDWLISDPTHCWTGQPSTYTYKSIQLLVILKPHWNAVWFCAKWETQKKKLPLDLEMSFVWKPYELPIIPHLSSEKRIAAFIHKLKPLG